MSRIDTRLAATHRAAMLAEIRAYLPAFLSAASSEQFDPVGDVSELLNLRQGDLDRVVAVHIALAQPVTDLVAALPYGIRRPLTATARPRVTTQAVRGPIDWGATIRQRSVSGGLQHTFVVRPAQRRFDIPENQAVAWLLSRLETLMHLAVSADADASASVHNSEWLPRIGAGRATLVTARRASWLRSITPQSPNASTLRALRAARTAFYQQHVPDVVELVRRLTEHPTAEDVTALLAERYFEPQRDWQLFEIVVALRLARAFAAHSIGRRSSRLLVGVGRAPYAHYDLGGGREVRLWYQTWPREGGRSVHTDARARHLIAAGPTRPDIVIEIVDRSGPQRRSELVILELKATASATYLGEGLHQLLGYMADRSELLARPPAGWLVAPASTAFVAAPQDAAELWVLSADEVAKAAVTRFAT
jgi:hypothetical protein